MKVVKKTFITFLVLVMFVSIVPGSYSNAAKKVKLNKTKLTLKVGKTYKLKLKNNKKKVKWSSTKKKVATVTGKGKVKAKKAGSAKIVAKAGKKKYTCKVTVKNDTSGNKSNTSINSGTSTTNEERVTADNLKKLADYINTNGRADESGDKYIWVLDEEFLGSITYKAYSDSFVFGYTCFDESASLESLLSMEFRNNQDIFSIGWVSVFGVCEGKIERKTYTKETGCNFTIISSPYEDEAYKEYLLKLVDLDLKLASSYWEELLREAGLTPKDIGFEKWI